MKQIALTMIAGLMTSGIATAGAVEDFSPLFSDYYLATADRELVQPVFTRSDTNADGVYDALSVRFDLYELALLYGSPAVKVYWPAVPCSSQAHTQTDFTTPKFLLESGKTRLHMAIELRRTCKETGAEAFKTFVYSAELSAAPVKVWSKVFSARLVAINLKSGNNLMVTTAVPAGGTAEQPGSDMTIYNLNPNTGSQFWARTMPLVR